ncbi:hypothetical protein CMUS01_01718 [Colletotrichum musicola]|uniref:Uncharacterized protein n=1 Tax=Colletotrichum musicola TaxID=2175873 RepID=A0A8H6NWF1_9PEZI|nr:hypothetical protein CMUS01_01718 [Colletotrichum musicola]
MSAMPTSDPVDAQSGGESAVIGVYGSHRTSEARSPSCGVFDKSHRPELAEDLCRPSADSAQKTGSRAALSLWPAQIPSQRG